jgi:hypothetical protein
MTQKAEDIINTWLRGTGHNGIELTLSTTMPNGHTLHLDFYPLLLMKQYHMYLWYDATKEDIRTEGDIHQAFMRDPQNDWGDMRDNILFVFDVDIEESVWEIVGSRP